MILVTINKANYEYDIHSLVKAFFPREEVKVVAEEADVPQDATLRLDLRWELGEPLSGADVLRIFLDGELAASVPVDYHDRIGTKNRMKRALYKLLSAHEGRTLPWGSLTGIRPVKIPMAFLEEGRSEDFIRDYMRETYFASDEKIQLSIEIAKRELALLGQLDYENGYSLYVGIPFCPSTCLYCSFTSYPVGQWASHMDEYLDAVEKELAFVSDAFRDRRLDAIYVGGGTPTTLSAVQLGRLFSTIEQRLDLSRLREYTVEAGRPDSITREKLAVIQSHGISRISVNPQTMKQETLDLIGRRHTVEQTRESFFLAREMGFDDINMDLIAGLPGEGLADISHTMEQLAELSPDSVTVHSLAVKRAARLRMQWEDYADMHMEDTPEMIRETARHAAKMGLFPYYLYRQKNMAGNFENVGYAKPGKEGLYNVLTMEEKQSIVAVGAGAISKCLHPDGRIERCENVKEVAQYIGRIEEMITRKRKLFLR